MTQITLQAMMAQYPDPRPLRQEYEWDTPYYDIGGAVVMTAGLVPEADHRMRHFPSVDTLSLALQALNPRLPDRMAHRVSWIVCFLSSNDRVGEAWMEVGDALEFPLGAEA